MNWSDVGTWLKSNAGTSAALVGELLTGQYPAAIAAGVALVSSATGSSNPDQALTALQGDPATMIRLKELADQENQSIRAHIETMTRLQLEDEQSEQTQTQDTIRSGDNSQDAFVRRTRPAQSWVALIAAIAYVFTASEPSLDVLLALLALPFSYAGLRQVGKGIDSFTNAWQAKKQSA